MTFLWRGCVIFFKDCMIFAVKRLCELFGGCVMFLVESWHDFFVWKVE